MAALKKSVIASNLTFSKKNDARTVRSSFLFLKNLYITILAENDVNF